MKFFSSGKMDNVMPSGHMAHSLPRENFKATPAPQVTPVVPHPAAMALQNAIVQHLRGGGGGGLSPAPMQPSGPSKIIASPQRLPRQ